MKINMCGYHVCMYMYNVYFCLISTTGMSLSAIMDEIRFDISPQYVRVYARN